MVVTYSESLRDLGVGLKDDLLKNIHRLDYLYFNIDSTWIDEKGIMIIPTCSNVDK